MAPSICPVVLLLAVLLAGCASPPAAPQLPVSPRAADAPETARRLLEEPLRVQLEERFYPVEGLSATHINLDLARRGAMEAGRGRHALTDFVLRWRYLPRVRGGRCAAEDVMLEIDIVTTLPRWEDRERAAPDLASDWDLYLARLREHEAGHQRIVLHQGRALLAAVEGLEAPDCATLADRTHRLARGTRGEVHAAHEAWDRETGFGLGGS